MAKKKQQKSKKKSMVDPKRFKLVKVSKLRKCPWNYKADDEALVSKLVANIKRNGQVEVIQVRHLTRGNLEVVNGNHRVDAFNELDLKEVFAYDMGKVSIKEAQRLALELNETRFKSDAVKMAEIIAGLAKTYSLDDLEETMPFSRQDIEDNIQLLNLNLDDYAEPAEPTQPEEAQTEEDVLTLRLSEKDTVMWRKLKKKFIGIADDNETIFRIVCQSYLKRLKKKKNK